MSCAEALPMERIVGLDPDGGRRPLPRALVEEAHAIGEATGDSPLISTSLVLAAWRGQEARVSALAEAGIQDSTTAGGEAQAIRLAEYARALLSNGLGCYEDARSAAQRACAHEAGDLSAWALPELIEAAVRTDCLDAATAALRRFEERAESPAIPWTDGMQARSRALLSDPAHAEALYLEAVEQLASGRVGLHLARTRLLYGEWLRRMGRRVTAREQLRAAHAAFRRAGADGFARRAGRELLATGERVRKRTAETRDELTAQEAQIAHLARDGHTNPEIGVQLFISPRTVEWHLRKVFKKLGIRSRRELRAALPAADAALSA
jgi:DNA-binding CsgD family transcriptional regulator